MMLRRFALFLCCLFAFSLHAKASLELCSEGKTPYVIVVQESSSEIEAFALRELRHFLKQSTGVDFPVVNEKECPKTNRIFLGMSEPARKCMGNSHQNMYPNLVDEEAVVQCVNDDLFLYGKGRYGNLWAVYEFLEHRVGCRFLDVTGFTHIPKRSTLSISRALRCVSYAFKVRSLMSYIYPDREEASRFLYRNRQNFDLKTEEPGIENLYEEIIPPHAIEMFIPAYTYEKRLFKFLNPPKWLRDKSYFTSNPEYFSMDREGKRVPDLHRCFTNPALKAELTKNLLRYYAEKKAEPKYANRQPIVKVGINDKAYNICYCPECQAVQKKYKSSGATLVLYMIELAEQHPDILFMMDAYQRALTQIPPELNRKLPPNLVIVFAPINANFSHPWNGTSLNHLTLTDLRKWSGMTHRIWCWYYPNTYIRDGRFMEVPSACLDRIATDIRILQAQGAEGTYFEQDSGGLNEMTNFTALQNYVMLKLFQDPGQNLDELIHEFITLYYGKAAPWVEKYYYDLRKEHLAFVDRGGKWIHWMNQSYLTLEKLKEWSALLEKALEAESGDYALHVRQLRLGLDCAILGEMRLNYDAELFRIHKERSGEVIREISQRFKLRKRRGGKTLQAAYDEWMKTLEAIQTEKPMPDALKSLPEENITVITPDPKKLDAEHQAADVLASKGTAINIRHGNSFFELVIRKKAGDKKPLIKTRFPIKDIPEKEYSLFKVGECTLTPESTIWIHQSLELPIGNLVTHFDDPASLATTFQIYAELRHDTRYRKTLCGRIFLVRPAK